jgi:2-dehydropantoate 2-reductase
VVTDRPIVVAGAGAIGCFVGGMLAAGGRRVALLVRPRIKTEIERFGLRLTDFDGSEKKLGAGQLALSEDPSIFHSAGIVLVTVKSADTADVAEQIAQHAPQDAVIVSLQNGVGNVAVLRERLGGRPVLAGLVPRWARAASTARPPATSMSERTPGTRPARSRYPAFRCARAATSPACNGAS